MKILDNFLLIARFTVLMGLLIIARLVSPNLTESALSEREYAEGDPFKASEDPAETSEMPVVFTAVALRSNTDASGFDWGRRIRRPAALPQN